MDDLEKKLTEVMSNPAMMEQIMALANSFQSPPEGEAQPESPQAAFSDKFDPEMLKRLSGFAGKSGISKEQKALLQALRPYLKGNRIQRLERAMQAAKMAGLATSFLGR